MPEQYANSIAIAKIQESQIAIHDRLIELKQSLDRSLERLERNEKEYTVQSTRCEEIVKNQKAEIQDIYEKLDDLEKSDRKIWAVLNKSKGAQVILASCCGAAVSIAVGVSIQLISRLLP